MDFCFVIAGKIIQRATAFVVGNSGFEDFTRENTTEHKVGITT